MFHATLPHHKWCSDRCRHWGKRPPTWTHADIEFRNSPKAKRRVRQVATRLRRALRLYRTSHTCERLGFTLDDLRRHIERQFTKGMTWERVWAGDIHIDHIRPLYQFDLTDEAEARAVNHLTNLQPLWAADNLRKGASRTVLI
ncbi:MAG: hypothetical protein LC676_10760 [Loktanella sp.]|nr:hypothetical protein [Loktanella sp.]